MAGTLARHTTSHWIAAIELETRAALSTVDPLARAPSENLRHAYLQQPTVLSRCSVLHVCANSAMDTLAGLQLCTGPLEQDEQSTTLSARAIVQQLWLQHCRLVILRSEERRVGKECVSRCRYGWP